jgi:hypothetical protein
MMLLAIAIGAAVATSPNSFAYAFLTGQCHGVRPPPACSLRTMRSPRHASGAITSSP